MGRLMVILLLLITSGANGQVYQVLHLKGEIIRVKDGELLKPGDKLDASEKINFMSKDAMAAVLSADKGRYIIKANESTEKQSDLIYVLKSAMAPVKGGMSTRAAGINNLVDFQLYFGQVPYVWAGDQIRLDVSSQAFPMNEKKFFYIQYDLNGESMNKMLTYDDDELIMEKDKLFLIDERAVSPADIDNYKLFYYDSTKEESSLITEIDFVLIDAKTLKNLYEQYQGTSEDAYYDIADILSDLYGTCDPLQLRYNLLNN